MPGASSSEVTPGFGAAKHFMPLPNTVVGAHCSWQLRLNTVPTRIPGMIASAIFLVLHVCETVLYMLQCESIMQALPVLSRTRIDHL